MSSSYFSFVESIKIPRLEAETPTGSGQIIFNDKIRGSTGSGSTSFLTAAPGANVQVFTASGTWVKPAGVQIVNAILIGGGGGGGSGLRSNVTLTGTARNGGAGGGGANMIRNAYALASSLLERHTVTVGAGGFGGASPATSTANAGGSGGTSTFLDFAAGGGQGATVANLNNASVSPTSGISDLPGFPGPASTYGYFPQRGGIGAIYTRTNTVTLGSNGATSGSNIFTSPISGGIRGGTGNGLAGTETTSFPGLGSGGGGGGGTATTGSAGGKNGGAGGTNGGGGGGGGGGYTNTAAAGAGGAGGSGIVVVISW
jgi:hypothetical protein